jgi:hypothetical protein
MPNVKVGSVIEFKYILKSENVVTFPLLICNTVFRLITASIKLRILYL